MFKEQEINRINQLYQKKFGHLPNLNNPQTFNEKILWIRLNEHLPLRHQICDKIQVRDYFIKYNLNKYLNTVYWYGNNLNDIIWNNLPNQFVIKATYGCNMNLIVWNYNTFNLNEYYDLLKSWLNKNDNGFEWSYRGLPKRLMIEKLLLNNDNKIPCDYKFYVLNGQVRLIHINKDRVGFNYSNDFPIEQYHLERFFYTRQWNKINMTYDNLPTSNNNLFKPKKLQEMINIAESIGQDFTFIRVDMYYLNDDTIILGELTNYPNGGFGFIKPIEIDYKLGSYLILNKEIQGGSYE